MNCKKAEQLLDLEDYPDRVCTGGLVETVEVNENAVSLMMFTSGTTGDGFKAAMLTQKGILADVLGPVPLGKPGDRLLSILPIHHCFEVFVGQMKYIYLGCTICISNGLKEFVNDLSLYQITTVVAVPALANLVASIVVKLKGEGKKTDEICKALGGHLNKITIGGASASIETIELLKSIGITIFVGYGLTETTGGCLANCDASLRPAEAGKPYVKGMQMMVNSEGELLLKGDMIMLGYYKNPGLTASVIDSDGWFHTGDLGEITAEGYAIIRGRKDNMIKSAAGEKIYPEELEARLLHLTDVSMAMVCLSEGSLNALLYLNNDTQETRQRIENEVQKINRSLADYEKMTVVRFFDKPFPTTTSLKIRRKEVLKMLEGQQNHKVKQPETEQQMVILSKVKSILPNREIGITDNLFEFGMDSLSAIQLSVLLDCEPEQIYTCKTVQALSEALEYKSFRTDEKLPHINDYINIKNPESNREHRCVLLTGATGFLGMHLLYELKKKNIEVVCLVRNPDFFQQSAQYYYPDVQELCSTELVKGDITKERLGLCEEIFLQLKNRIDSVFHAAALVSHVGSMDRSYEVNVRGTQNIIDFCKAAGAGLYHISSYAVSGFDTTVPLTERVLDVGQKISGNPYILTKYKAEERVLLSRKEGIKSTIFRLGNLTARASDGKFQINENENGMQAQLRAFGVLGIYPESMAETVYDFTAVDEAAKAIVLLSLCQNTGHIWHIMNPHVLSVRQLAGKDISPVKDDAFIEKMTEMMEDRDVAILSVYYHMNRARFNSNFNMNATLQTLRDLHFEWSFRQHLYL